MEEEALEFARKAHGDQQRKYNKELYIEHPKRVAEIVRKVPHTPQMICAAYLHDVVEDTPVSIEDIRRKFGREIAKLVHELTDEFIKERYPDLNRKKRKEKEVARQAEISPEAKTIKLADVIDNTRDIIQNDKNFARRYVPEMEKIAEAIQGGNFKLLMRACYEIEKGKIVLKKNQQERKS